MPVQLRSLSLVGDNSLVYKFRVMPVIGRHINATYYTWQPALISVYEKRQSVMRGKLFSSYRTVFVLAQGFQDSKTSELNCSYRKRHLSRSTCQDRVFASSLYVLSLSSVLGRFIHLYCHTDSLGRGTRNIGGIAPLLPHVPNIFASNILSKTGGKLPVL